MGTYFSGHLTTVKDGSLGDEQVIVSQLFTVMKFFIFLINLIHLRALFEFSCAS